MKRFLIFTLVLLSGVISIVAIAHSGGTDAKGGHYDYSTGEYHYHSSGQDYSTVTSIVAVDEDGNDSAADTNYYITIACLIFIFLALWPCAEDYPFEHYYDVSIFGLHKLKSYLFQTSNSAGIFIYYLIKITACVIPLIVIKEYNPAALLTLFIFSLSFSKTLLPLLWSFSLCNLLPSLTVFAITYYIIYAVFWAKETFYSIYIISSLLTVVQKAQGKISISDSWRDEKKQKKFEELKEKIKIQKSEEKELEETDFQVICPNCKNPIWYKSTQICPHCNFDVQDYFRRTRKQ